MKTIDTAQYTEWSRLLSERDSALSEIASLRARVGVLEELLRETADLFPKEPVKKWGGIFMPVALMDRILAALSTPSPTGEKVKR